MNEQDDAAKNRQRVADGYCNDFYDRQKKIAMTWALGTPAPKGLILGELPYLDTRPLRLDKARRRCDILGVEEVDG